MILEPYANKLSEPLAFWAANCNAENLPEIVHCNGLLPVEAGDQLTFFIAEAFSVSFIANLAVNPQITFLGCSVLTFESYQYKGRFEHIRPCTLAEITMQEQYIDAFTNVISNIGYSKAAFSEAYLRQPSYAVTMRVTDIFEQTPHKGTGSSMIKK
ncbi:MAG: hypothetical protein WCF67_05910 [Chitinophagaceae bacterium]